VIRVTVFRLRETKLGNSFTPGPHPQNGRRIFASYTSGKGLITRIYRKFRKLNSQNISDPMKKWENKLNRAFIKKKSK
jgi:hypothetical protein